MNPLVSTYIKNECIMCNVCVTSRSVDVLDQDSTSGGTRYHTTRRYSVCSIMPYDTRQKTRQKKAGSCMPYYCRACVLRVTTSRLPAAPAPPRPLLSLLPIKNLLGGLVGLRLKNMKTWSPLLSPPPGKAYTPPQNEGYRVQVVTAVQQETSWFRCWLGLGLLWEADGSTLTDALPAPP